MKRTDGRILRQEFWPIGQKKSAAARTGATADRKKAASRQKTGDEESQESRLTTLERLMLACATTVWVTAA